MKKITGVLAALALILFTVGCSGQNIDAIITFDCLNSFIKQEMESENIPGLSASIIRDNEIVWVNSFGYADIANKIKVSLDLKNLRCVLLAR